MRIGRDDHTYEWIDNWTRLPDTELGRRDKTHHGMVVTESQEVVMFHEGGPSVLVLDLDGNLLRSWNSTLTNAHGMDLVKEDGSEYLWMADNKSGQVVKTDLWGGEVMSLRQPDLPVYSEGKYKPTWVAVNQERWGGNGDVWVADGYGESYVHRYDRNGNYVSSNNGDEGGGRFDCPHGIFIDTRKSEPELYISGWQLLAGGWPGLPHQPERLYHCRRPNGGRGDKGQHQAAGRGCQPHRCAG